MGLLHLALGIVDILPELTLREAVFLMPLWLVGQGVLLCNWEVSMSGLQKVTHLAVLLMLLGVGEVGTLKSSTWEVAAKLGTLKAMIPSLSEVV